MKKITYLIFLATLFSQAQTIYFEQDFETTDAITNIRNISQATGEFKEDVLTVGPPPCTFMSKGNAMTVNSTDVDYNSAQNDTDFLNLNPQVLCDAYTIAGVKSIEFDMSSVIGGAYVSGRYYISSTLSYGTTNMAIGLNNGTDNLGLDITFFPVRDTWTTFEFPIPAAFLTSTMVLGIGVQAGQAFGFDDLVVSDYSVLSVPNQSINELKLYPNPVVNGEVHLENFSKVDVEIFNILGKKVKNLKNVSNKFRVDDLNSGIYIVKFNDGSNSVTKKIIKVD
ncbi:Por secretion system C-terminal sorting domain-containing protein [Flavobacteriaceae bacterium MAR_2010_188]|nr:Por secretion system C-terminal sorting domain-containing protein [Flavobacteriaceae bacterium MAR_2010_188]